jgi:peptidoglycan-associated lipoprotein
MNRHKSIWIWPLIVFTAVTMGGCSSETATKSDAKSASPADAATSSGDAARPAKDAAESQKQASAAPGTGSSLEALQRGESTATAGPLQDVYFDFDSYEIRADAREALKANWDWLRANPAARVEVEGHCDERGTSEYNLALGAKRAQRVKDYLVTLGTGTDRLSTISYGAEVPVCKEQTEECWQKNRRARFVVQGARPTS